MAGNRTNLQVGLSFSADTSQARREIISLQKQLNELATSTNLKSKDFGLGEASKAAAELAANLQLSTNFETGKLDLTKFQKNLQASGKELKDYQKIMQSLGPEGTSAFNNLANAILQAEVPLTKANKLVSSLWYSFKQTAKYQFTSSIYRGLISGIRSAYQYAQDLNESLNNIRIVTGQSTDQMARFAEQANKAAQVLSTTTTDYTNAALIYYQQGLNDEEVKARTDVTMKLANASGVSAETASEQLTAIWNNFAKGSENLEYFADVMTALGASTASSTSEIAEGLEKFAAIGNTVGLSYEYAASALATVTATTRQSADVVGTAFKTLFARIQDLEVGETLEDGTTLGKYSQALAAVGVNIKDANGELKAMDKILEEMATAWNTISKDQQVALAQTVAGTRQYTQLVALMENWSFMQQNLQTSYNSAGTVQKQQEIYAESWEAARDRVKAAAEGIYNSLLDDEFFIKLTNGFGNIIQFISDTIKGIGGLKSVLPIVISLFTSLFSDKLANEIDRINLRIKDTLGITQKAALSLKTNALSARIEGISSGEKPENAFEVSGNNLANLKKKEQETQYALLEQSGQLNEFELKRKQLQLDQIHNLIQEVELNDNRLEQIKKETEELEEKNKVQERYIYKEQRQDFINANKYSQEKLGLYKNEENQTNKDNLKEQAKLIINDERSTQDMIDKAQKLYDIVEKNRGSWKNVTKAVDELVGSLGKVNEEVEKLDGHDLRRLWNKGEKQDIIADVAVRNFGKMQGYGENLDAKDLTKTKEFLSDFFDEIQADQKKTSGASNELKELGKTILSLGENFDIANLSTEDAYKLFEKLLPLTKQYSEQALKDAIKTEKEFAEKTGQSTENIEQNRQKTADLVREQERMGASSEFAGQKVDQLSNKVKQLKDATITTSQAMVNFASSISGVWGSISSLFSVIDTWGDKSATSSQKIGGLISTISSFAFTGARLAKDIKSFSTPLENAPKLLTKIASKFSTTAVAGEAAGTAIAGTGTAAATATATVGTLTATLGIFIIAASALVAIGYGIYRAFTKDARAAKEAAEAAKELTDSYNEAKESAEELKTTITDYNDSIEEMKKLSAGTDEYTEALNKANEAAETLIEKIPNLNWKYNAQTGAIEFLDDLEEINKKQKEQLSKSELTSKISQIEANRLSDVAGLTSLIRGDDSWISPAQLISDKLKNNDQRESVEELQKVYEKTNSIEEAIEQTNFKFVEALGGKDALKKYFDQVIKNQNDTLQIQKQLIDSNYSDEESYKNTSNDIKDLLNTSLATQTKQASTKYKTNELLGRYGNSYKKYWMDDDENRILAEYADYMGYSHKKSIWSGQVKVYNNDKEVNITYEQAREILAQAKALEEVKSSIGSTAHLLEQTINVLKEFGTTREDAISFLTSWSGGKTGNLANFTQQQLSDFDASDLGITDEVAKALGWETAQNFIEAIQNQAELDKKAFDNIGKGTAKAVLNALNETAKDPATEDFIYTLADSQQLEKIFSEAFTKGGTEGVLTLKNLLKTTNDPIGLMTALENVDWRTADFDSLKKKLKDLGIEIKDESTLKKYYEDAKQAATETYYLTNALEDLLKTYKEIDDIIGKLDFGSIITEEQYQALIKYNEGLKELFALVGDNQYKFLGTSEDLADTQNKTWEEIAEQYSNNQQVLKNLQDSFTSWMLDKESTDSNYTIASNYAGFSGSNPFNEAAGRIAEISQEELQRALIEGFDENGNVINEVLAKKVDDYSEVLIDIFRNWGDKFSSRNFVTFYINQMAKSSDDFDKVWAELKEKFGNVFKDLEDYKETAKELAFTNELTSKGLDLDKYKDYYRYLQKINGELIDYEDAAKRIALANLNVQKGLENLNSNFDSYIEGLTEAVGSAAHQQALDSIRQDLADIMSVEVEDLYNVNEAFIAQHQQLIEDAANGNEDALAALEIFTAMAIGNLDEDTRKVLEDIQQRVLNADPGEIIIPVTAKWAENIPDIVKDAMGMEQDNEGNWRSQGKWGQRANLQTLQNKAAEKNKSGKSKTLKELDDEIDRYHYIRKQLKDIERELERVNKAKERAYGAQHLKYLDQEIEYLKEQAGLQDKYVNEIEGYLAKDRGLIAAYGAKFDEFGNISNYNQLFASNFNKYANADDSTNWENFKKALSKYEETLDLWFEQTEEKAEILRQILDKQLEGIQYKVNVKVELDDRELALLEYQLNRLDDAAYDTAEALVNIGSQFEVVEDKIKATTDGIVDTLKTIPGITQAQIDAYLAGDGAALAGLHIEQGQLDMLEDYSDQLLELSNTLKELHDNALQKVSEAFDAWGEKIEDHVAKFQHLNALIENYQEIIGLLGRSNIGISNEFMREMRNQQITNLQGILNTRTQVKDNLAAQLADARKRASEAATEAEREDWEQVADDIEQRLKEATESWQQAWIDALQANKEAFEQTMQELVDSFDDYADELKRYDTAQDRYLETYRQAYELSKLTRDIENSINDQDSIRAKKELQKLEDKITAIKESGRAISENELDLLRKEYELRLAEIALEDAQNAKSLVRLNRDNEGNWGYVYTADQDKINEAQQNYEDKLYEYMRAADTMAEEASRTILTLNKEMAEALAALDANAVDYEAKVAEITQFYADQINYFAEQYGISTDAMVNVARESAAKYKPDVVDIIDSDNSGLQTNFDETVLAIIGDFEDLEDAINGPEGALPRIREAYTETIIAFEDYREQNAKTCELAGADVSKMRELMEKEFGKIKTQTVETDVATKTMADDMKGYLDQVLVNFGDFATKYSNKVKTVSDANTALADSIIKLENALQNIDVNSLNTIKKAADQVKAIAQQLREVGNGNGSNGGGIQVPSGGGSTNNISYDGEESENAAVAAAADAYNRAKKNNKASTNNDFDEEIIYNKFDEVKDTGDDTYHILYHKARTNFGIKTLSSISQKHTYVYDKTTQNYVSANNRALRCSICNHLKVVDSKVMDKYLNGEFATGGYTGEWGSSGKLAVLHEKELVLNKEDTANILDAVSLIRQMTLGTAQLSMGLGNIGAGLSNLNINPASMDQHVEIAASFPGVTDRYEIEEAFNNLVNKASQYAFRDTTRYEPQYI